MNGSLSRKLIPRSASTSTLLSTGAATIHRKGHHAPVGSSRADVRHRQRARRAAVSRVVACNRNRARFLSLLPRLRPCNDVASPLFLRGGRGGFSFLTDAGWGDVEQREKQQSSLFPNERAPEREERRNRLSSYEPEPPAAASASRRANLNRIVAISLATQ